MQNKKIKKSLFALTISAAMVALSVIFCRFLGYSAEGTPLRFELGFLPIAVIGYIAGPIYSGLGYLVADIIGSLFSGYAPNVWITLCQFLFGFTMGLFFHKKHSMKRSIICFSAVALIIDFLLKSPIFVVMYGWTWEYTLLWRAVNALINLPIRIIFYYLLMNALKKPIQKFII